MVAEYHLLEEWKPNPCPLLAFEANESKNRCGSIFCETSLDSPSLAVCFCCSYYDLPCIDTTRVRLQPGPGMGPPTAGDWNDYIHANYVQVDVTKSPCLL